MKRLIFVGDSHRVLSEFPEPVQRHVGFALYQAQVGNKHPDAKPLRNFPSGVLEVVTDHRGDTFRTIYTVRLKTRSTYFMPFKRNQGMELRLRRVKSKL